MCHDLDTLLIAEGIETAAEAATLRGLGVRYHQGFWYAKPALEHPGVISAIRPLADVATAHEETAAFRTVEWVRKGRYVDGDRTNFGRCVIGANLPLPRHSANQIAMPSCSSLT